MLKLLARYVLIIIIFIFFSAAKIIKFHIYIACIPL